MALSPRQRLLAELHRARARAGLPPADLHGGDEGDRAAFHVERDTQGVTVDAARRRVRALEAALGRLDDGTYGVCVDCAQTVPSKRLEAVPEAERCVGCQSAADRLSENS